MYLKQLVLSNENTNYKPQKTDPNPRPNLLVFMKNPTTKKEIAVKL